MEENGDVRARCLIFSKSYAYGSSPHRTKNLRHHIEGCPKRTISSVDQLMMDCDTKLRRLRISQEIYHEKMTIGSIKHNYPYLIMKHEGIRDVHIYLNHEVKPYTRNTAKADCLKIYYREKEKIKLALERVSGTICLTSDIWSSCTTDGHISLTAHYVDENWELQSRILNFCHIPPLHSRALLSKIVYDFLKDWGIEKKVFSLTLDNASNNDKMEDILRSQLCVQNALLCGGSFFHVRCCAHILNPIVQERLKVSSVALHKICESVKYVKGSEAKRIKFGELAKQIGVINSKGCKLVPQKCVESSRVQVRLYEEMENEDEVVSIMASQMKVKLDKYWDSYSVVLAIVAIVDPRFKFEFVEFYYKKVDGPIVESRKLEFVKEELYKLFVTYEGLSCNEFPPILGYRLVVLISLEMIFV
ncbi:zinc finger BED domain-containing protein RICESLEEPER 2-like [Pistacia vera]|uniref:zinc finger BED domain-containing protein RICESLEEPER 2-like n=1 Tax=Pistacia vera TaxID=55513 RepID=UPI0012630E4C|nr:zinc finger BED domain-containing protein RICESLEEPER 2-like [Pistacia vera]